MTTREKLPGTDQAPDPEGGLAVRLWVGQNPLLFVAGCLMIGYWLGRGASRGHRS